MKVRYNTTIYNKKYPYGHNVTRIAEGTQVEKPAYLAGCNNRIFVKTEKGIIHIIEPERIIKKYN